MADLNQDYPSTDDAVQFIPVNNPKNLKVTNTDVVQKVIAVYLGTHRVGRTKVTLENLAAAPANEITVCPPLPPETVEQIANDAKLAVVEVP